MDRRILIALIGLAALVATGVAFVFTTASSGTGLAYPSAAEVRDLQSKADAACLCDRRRPGDLSDRACWAEFDQSIARYEHYEMASACMAASETMVCFGNFETGPSDDCIQKNRAYGACSAEEVRLRQARARETEDGGCD